MKFFNTLTRQLEDFQPMHPPQVSMYTCGPTIHDYAHIGNFRTYVFEDLLRRYLKFRDFEVTQVMNLTDVEDKIIRKSRESGTPFKEYTRRYAEAFFEDLKTLNIEPVEHYPRATECVDKMVEIIRKLLADGIAYRSEDGSIYYNIRKFPSYGQLAHIEVDQLQAGARVAQDEYEKDQACDFALWKAWDEADGEVYWDQYPDMGKGRPGWHIECSAMSLIHLGESFDIHCGGVDNIFPHHQNEIAQSEAFTGKKFVNYWLHSEHLQVAHKKMSKSLGNFTTLRELVSGDNLWSRKFDPMVIRWALLVVHYRSKLDFTLESLEQAEQSLERIVDCLRRCREQKTKGSAGALLDRIEKTRAEFVEAMDVDLKIPEGVAAIFNLVSEMNRAMAASDVGVEAADKFTALMTDLDRVLGVKLMSRLEDELDPALMALIEERTQARKDKNWKRSDELRQELLDKGVAVEDTPQGVRWKLILRR